MTLWSTCTGQCRGFRWTFTYERTTTLTSPWRALRKKHIPCTRSSSAAGRTQPLQSATTERNQTRWVLHSNHNSYCRTYISRFLHIRPKYNILFRITDVVRFVLSRLYPFKPFSIWWFYALLSCQIMSIGYQKFAIYYINELSYLDVLLPQTAYYIDMVCYRRNTTRPWENGSENSN